MKRLPGRVIWGIVLALVALQLYVVQELVAALILFAVVFLAFALLVGLVRVLQLAWERAFAFGEALRSDFSRKLFRRPRSATAR